MNEQFIYGESDEPIFAIIPYKEYLELISNNQINPPNNLGNLQTKIAIEVNDGNLAKYWTTSDLINNTILRGEYAENTLRTHPANHSMSIQGVNLGDGFSVNKDNPIYLRTAMRGRALVYVLPEHIK